MSNCSKLNSSKKECPYSLTCVDKIDACPLNRLEILKLPLDNWKYSILSKTPKFNRFYNKSIYYIYIINEI